MIGWRVVENENDHWGMRRVAGPALNVVGFTVASDVSAEYARQVETDARLIAAAPDLLKALEQIIDDWAEDGLCCCQQAKNQALDAYEKATGRRVPE